MRLSVSDQELLLRKQPQQSKLHLSIFQPRHIMKARLNNASAAKGDRTIPYDTVTLGSSSLVESGMTLLVGTSDGASDIGKIRIKSATASQFVVSENSNLEWVDNAFLTVVYFFELWPIFPRIISDPADDENVIFYKDYDTVYSNQNSILGTFVNAGSHWAAFRDCASGLARHYYSSTGTYNLLGSSLNYNWTFEGGSPSSSSSPDPGYVNYSTPGHYVTRLQISGSNGAVDTTYRYGSVYDHPSCGTGTVPTAWEFSSFDGSRSEGGYNVRFKVRQNVNVSDGSVVVIFSEDWYGDTKTSFGGNYPNSSEIFFVGYVLKDTIKHNYKDSFVEFEAASITGLMKNSIGFSVSVESKASPTKWFELLDLDCRRAIYHYLKWHTTALSIADWQFVGDDHPIQFFDADRTSMYDAIDNLMRGTLIGSLVSDRQGKAWAEVGAEAYTDPESSFTSVMTISKRDWMNEPTIDERLQDDVSYLELGGIAYSGVVTGTFSALMASAPGNAPGFRGKIDRRQGLALLGQSQLNQLVGNLWANENSKYPNINMEGAVSFRNLDIAPQETVRMSILASDTFRNVAVNGLYIPQSFNWRVDSKNGVLRPTIGFRELVTGDEGETIDIPHSPTEGGLDTGFSVPGLQIPPLPTLTFPPALTEIITTIINSQGSTFTPVRVNIGWHSNTSVQVISHVGIDVNVKTRSAGAGEIELADIPSGYYYLSGHAMNYVLGGATAGQNIFGQLSLQIAGVVDAFVDQGSVIQSDGGARVAAAVSMIYVLDPSKVVQLSWGCGKVGAPAVTFENPYEFILTLHKIANV